MISETNEFELANLTWEEAGERLPEADYVALPCGSIEQHSYHLPLSVDSIRADHLTRKLAAEAPAHDLDILMLPTLTYGQSEHHMSFPGTVTLMPDTYRDVVIQIGRSVQEHGAERFLLVNFHGGNRGPLRMAADRLQRDHDLTTHSVFWVRYAQDHMDERFDDNGGHADAHETSVIELVRPELVKADRKEPQIRKERAETQQYRYFDDITEQGGLGDPTISDPEFMEGVIEEATDDLLESLRADVGNES